MPRRRRPPRRYLDRFPRPSRPLPVEEGEGIRARTQRGTFGESWWGQRWIGVLEGFGLGARLGRGRRYARAGQVLSIEVDEDGVRARVQGSRQRPYRVEIRLPHLPSATWRSVVRELAADMRFGASLLAGELPAEAEESFRRAGAPLLPGAMEEIATECSCPDWSNPCKHIAAVHLLLAEELDRDPLLLLALRGIRREELLEVLSEDLEEGRSKATGAELAQGGWGAEADGGEGREELPADPELFWGGGSADAERFVFAPTGEEATLEVRAPEPPAPLLRRLGPVPFWRGQRDLATTLEEVHRRASAAALELLAGEG